MTQRKRFSGQTVLIVGAAGGLGSAYAQAFAAEGAQLLLAGRRRDSLQAVAHQVDAAEIFSVDLADPQSILALAQDISQHYSDLSAIVNATGCDIRKPYVEHTLEEIDQTLDVNLRGSMLLTYAFLPIMQQAGQGMIVHMGGFADGRLVFPYYTADSASRAGLRGFVDAINLEIKGSGVMVCYFCPSPADTLAERPFHPLWRQMGIQIVSPEKVARELLDTVVRRKPYHVMGGMVTRSFARLNAAFPGIANILAMDRYTTLLRQFFAPASILDTEVKLANTPSRRLVKWLSVILITLSFLLYGMGLFLLPLIPMGIETKALLIPSALVSGEIAFWIGVLLVGKEAATQYRQCFNLCRYIRLPKRD